jgi:hypothetical protein
VTLGIKTKGGGLSGRLLFPRTFPWDFFAEIFNIFGIADIFVIRAL